MNRLQYSTTTRSSIHRKRPAVDLPDNRLESMRLKAREDSKENSHVTQIRTNRVRFCVFLKILLRQIQVEGNHELHRRLSTRIERSVAMVAGYGGEILKPLGMTFEQFICAQIRPMAGELQWQKARNYTRWHLMRQERRRSGRVSNAGKKSQPTALTPLKGISMTCNVAPLGEKASMESTTIVSLAGRSPLA